MHLLHVPETPDQDLPEEIGGQQHLCEGVLAEGSCAGSESNSGSTQRQGINGSSQGLGTALAPL